MREKLRLVQVAGSVKWLLFVNWGACCSGKDSTYEIRVGMADTPAGPFEDKERSEPCFTPATNVLYQMPF